MDNQEETEAQDISYVQWCLEQSASAFRDLYDSITESPLPPEENPVVVFDHTAEAICRDCTLRTLCWKQEYEKTFDIFNRMTPALMKHGLAKKEDFPQEFSSRCAQMTPFLTILNRELSAFLLRRQYRSRLLQTRKQAVIQYEELSELLASTASSLSKARPASTSTLLRYQVGVSMHPKYGETISGDSINYFETDNASLCLVLSDGMGSGEMAKKESALTVRLLERFLRAGVDALPALKTLNNALALRAESSNSFTTIDLLVLSLKNGDAEVYKYGAAPSYIKKKDSVRRINSSCLPAGLQQNNDLSSEVTRFHLAEGAFFVMMSDGIVDSNDDKWLLDFLVSWDNNEPQSLVNAIVDESCRRYGASDDGGVFAVYLPPDSLNPSKEV